MNALFTCDVKNRTNRYMRKCRWFPKQIVDYCRLKCASTNMSSRDKNEGGDLYIRLLHT
ncbi:MAG: hypothetical protein J1E57_06995 [Prevotella sp.]|nr:hypothetical protein [Prevotella sp.]